MLSLTHHMLSQLELQTDATRLNAIVNHPDVYPWVKGFADGELDISPVLQEEGTVCLLGEHGGLLFHKLQPGLYEIHTQIKREGRGPWALHCAQAALHWLFSKTDAVEVLTKCPQGNVAAKALARACHLSYEFTNRAGWILDGKVIPADIYSLKVQDWMRAAPGLSERGEWFHNKLTGEFKRLGVPDLAHEDDATHDRYVGAACEMILGGQPEKGVLFYNRWARLASYAPIEIVSIDPVAFNIGNALVVMRGQDFFVPSVHSLN
jgi:hypothetical protein